VCADDRLFVRYEDHHAHPDLLVLRQPAWVGRAIGVTFALLGAGTIAFFTHVPRASVQGSIVVAYIVGGMFILVGLTLAAMTRDERVTFDRPAGLVHITSGRKTTDYPLAQVSGVALEASSGIDTQPGATPQIFYRPILILADGRHIPWTSMSTSDGRSQAACVAAARAFGRWAAAVPGDATPVPAPPPMAMRVRGTNYAGAYLMLGLLSVPACWMMGLDVLRLATWHPVPATVMGSTVEVIHGNKGGVSYRPAVSYWYQQNGTQYVATGVTPLKFGAGWKWAQTMAHRFTPGAQVTAYVDPHNPSRAFLVHQLDMLPLVFVGIIAVIWALVLWSRPRTGAVAADPTDLGVPVLARSPMPSMSSLR
jgi:hypothetical protein